MLENFSIYFMVMIIFMFYNIYFLLACFICIYFFFLPQHLLLQNIDEMFFWLACGSFIWGGGLQKGLNGMDNVVFFAWMNNFIVR